MTTITTIFVLALSIVLGRYFLGKWINHISIYAFAWSAMILTYEMKLIAYKDITSEAYSIICISYIVFLLSALVPVFYYQIFVSRNLFVEKSDFEINTRTLEHLQWIAIAMTLISIFSSVNQWYVLIRKFGSIGDVIMSASKVYRLRTEKPIEGVIPYLTNFAYAAIVINAIIAAVKNRLTVLLVISVFALLASEIAFFGRYAMMLSLCMVLFTLILSKNILILQSKPLKNYRDRRNMVYALIIIGGLIIMSASFVKSLRGANDNFRTTNKALSAMGENRSGFSIINASIYMYISSPIVVFSEYLKYDEMGTLIGQNTFMPIYNLVSKTGVVPHQDVYPRGYFIPMWSNMSTYLREARTDFGYFGFFLVPGLLGFLTSYYWYRCYLRRNISDIIILVYLFTIVATNCFIIATRSASFTMSWLLLLIIMQGLQRIPGNSFFRKFPGKAV